jgi:hypothetical protein
LHLLQVKFRVAFHSLWLCLHNRREPGERTTLAQAVGHVVKCLQSLSSSVLSVLLHTVCAVCPHALVTRIDWKTGNFWFMRFDRRYDTL